MKRGRASMFLKPSNEESYQIKNIIKQTQQSMKSGRGRMFLKTKQRGKPSYAAVPPVWTSSMTLTTDHLNWAAQLVEKKIPKKSQKQSD